MIRVKYLQRNPYRDDPNAGECCGGWVDSGGSQPCGNKIQHDILLICDVPYPRKTWKQYTGTERGFVVAVCTGCLHELGLMAGDAATIDLEPDILADIEPRRIAPPLV